MQDKPIWHLAEAAHTLPHGRHYHGFQHPAWLYVLADGLGIPYDPALDISILTHDVVYDHLPEKELRSIAWLLAHPPVTHGLSDAVIDKACDLMRSTIRHDATGDDRLAKLDLFDFRDLKRSVENRERLILEHEALYGMGRADFLAANRKFLTDMADRIEASFARVRFLHQHWVEIVDGIRNLVAMPDISEIEVESDQGEGQAA